MLIKVISDLIWLIWLIVAVVLGQMEGVMTFDTYVITVIVLALGAFVLQSCTKHSRIRVKQEK